MEPLEVRTWPEVPVLEDVLSVPFRIRDERVVVPVTPRVPPKDAAPELVMRARSVLSVMILISKLSVVPRVAVSAKEFPPLAKKPGMAQTVPTLKSRLPKIRLPIDNRSLFFITLLSHETGYVKVLRKKKIYLKNKSPFARGLLYLST